MVVVNMPRAKKPRGKISERQLALRKKLWPDLTANHIWNRHHHDGFASVPRTMPQMLSIMDDLKKGHPVSSTYLELWSRAFDESFVTLSKPREIAFAAGFTGQRGERTWRERMQVLAEFGFIDLKEGSAGPMSYAVIFNPYLVIDALYKANKGNVRADKYNALVARALEIRADDFELDNPFFAAAPAAAASA